MDASQLAAVGVELVGPARGAWNQAAVARIVSLEALTFVRDLVRVFRPRIAALLAAREERQRLFDERARVGAPILEFAEATRAIREGDWRCAPLPADLLDRRVEITGPVDRKMVINALNSGAQVFMADFEDATSPTWDNLMEGQVNLADAVRRDITFQQGERRYALNAVTATLMVRPRGLHLTEAHVRVDGAPIPGALLDFGLFCFHNAAELVARGTGAYFYLPKLESAQEAELWNLVFLHAESRLGLATGALRATVLIETLPAAFEMDEILYALRDHAAGLNCGRWDYIFSFIKKHRASATALLPDRAVVTMDKAFLRAYSLHLIEVCHRRGVHAMGGMAAQIPVKNDAAANERALERVRADKLREVRDGHDGTWVAHPGLVAVAREVFDAHMPGANQITRPLTGLPTPASALLEVHEGTKTVDGLRHNIRVGIQYIEAWLGGQGCVPLYHLMEDAATAEISRAQVWQWIRQGLSLEGVAGPEVLTAAFYAATVEEELTRIRTEVGETRFTEGRFGAARALFDELVTSENFSEFLTVPAYARAIWPPEVP